MPVIACMCCCSVPVCVPVGFCRCLPSVAGLLCPGCAGLWTQVEVCVPGRISCSSGWQEEAPCGMLHSRLCAGCTTQVWGIYCMCVCVSFAAQGYTPTAPALAVCGGGGDYSFLWQHGLTSCVCGGQLKAAAVQCMHACMQDHCSSRLPGPQLDGVPACNAQDWALPHCAHDIRVCVVCVCVCVVCEECEQRGLP